MQKISDFIRTVDIDHLNGVSKKVSRETQRGQFLEYFLTKINPDRLRGGYPPLTMGRMVKMLEKVPTGDLHAFQKQCDQAKHFSKYFFWALRPISKPRGFSE